MRICMFWKFNQLGSKQKNLVQNTLPMLSKPDLGESLFNSYHIKISKVIRSYRLILRSTFYGKSLSRIISVNFLLNFTWRCYEYHFECKWSHKRLRINPFRRVKFSWSLNYSRQTTNLNGKKLYRALKEALFILKRA